MSTTIARPFDRSSLSVARYARIMGVNPVHFQGATGATVFPVTQNTCSDLWPRHSYQFSDHVSHEDLARAIYDAERDIAYQIGYFPAPTWIAQEMHQFPRHHRRDMWRSTGLNVRGARVSLRTDFSKIIAPGQRAVTLVGTATVAGGTLVYSDEDGDGFDETATITLATTLTDVCEIKVYQPGEGGNERWEIRPIRSKTITGGNVVIVIDSWLLLDPDLQAAYPTTAGFGAIDADDSSNYLQSVDVYREYNDTTATSASFFWEPKPKVFLVGSICTSCNNDGCAACTLIQQNGCLHVRDVDRGIVVPEPATYSATDAAWSQDAFTECRDPDQVRIYYYAGDYDNRYLRGDSCEPLSDYWAHAIAWLATARLDRDPCQCGTVQKFFDHLRTDLSMIQEKSYQVSPEMLDNPFGTRRGEIKAWQRVARFNRMQLKGGVI